MRRRTQITEELARAIQERRRAGMSCAATVRWIAEHRGVDVSVATAHKVAPGSGPWPDPAQWSRPRAWGRLPPATASAPVDVDALPELPAPVDVAPGDPVADDIATIDAWLAEAEQEARRAREHGNLQAYAQLRRLMLDALERRRKMRPPPPPAPEETEAQQLAARDELVAEIERMVRAAEDEERETGHCYRCGSLRAQWRARAT